MGASQEMLLAAYGAPSYYLPTQVASGALDVWLKADALTGLANLDPVPSFTDSSGLGRHATQTGTARPLYIASATPNGMPALRFDAVNDYMIFPSMPIRAAHTLLWVAKSASNTLDQSFLGTNAAASRGILSGYSDNQWTWYAGSQTNIGATSTSLFQVIGEKIGQSTTPAFAWFLGAYSSGGSPGGFWGGDLCEFIAFDQAISTTEYNLLVQGLKDKYAL